VVDGMKVVAGMEVVAGLIVTGCVFGFTLGNFHLTVDDDGGQILPANI